jgi:hypothetical protein
VSLIASAVAIITLLTALASEPLKAWVRGHSYWVFVALVLSVAGAFGVVDYVSSRRRDGATEHDLSVVAKIVDGMPPDGDTIVWLKESFISKYVPVKYLDVIGAVRDQMERNVLGLDDPESNQAYETLRDALGEFHSLICSNLFMDDEYKTMISSDEWPWDQWKEASDQINEARGSLVRAYDSFLRACHRSQLV